MCANARRVAAYLASGGNFLMALTPLLNREVNMIWEHHWGVARQQLAQGRHRQATRQRSLRSPGIAQACVCAARPPDCWHKLNGSYSAHAIGSGIMTQRCTCGHATCSGGGWRVEGGEQHDQQAGCSRCDSDKRLLPQPWR